jgi:cellulose synthase/poly-beta-1,6-N-acetylglucosamine synthase-like glycosyltransferase
MVLLGALQIILGLLLAYYTFVLVGLLVGLKRLNYTSSTAKPFVSVIVAARNEAVNVAILLEHLVRQDYPTFEIIIVNDRSTDRTKEIIQQFQSRDERIHRIDVSAHPEQMPSKKHALAKGISLSKGEILCFTDADCLPPIGWISALVAAFDDRTGLVAGFSPYRRLPSPGDKDHSSSRLFYRFIEYEEFKGAIWSAGAIGVERGWLCTGRTLAYRRCVYDEVRGFESIKQSVSGDDDLFLQLVRHTTTWKIRYVTAPESFVPTIPPNGFNEFVQQRVRHFSAGKFFSPSMKAFFLTFHTANLIFLLALLGSLMFDIRGSLYWPYLIKSVVDSAVFFIAAPAFRETSFAPSYLLMELLYVLYNAIIGPIGLTRRFEWKPDEKS